LCSWLHDRFGRDQHDSLIRQLFHIRQVGSVQEYTDKFSELVDQLVAYENCYDHRYFTTHFVDGLKHHIKYVVLVQRPTDLDTACALALLQEEASAAWRKEFKCTDFAFKPKLAMSSTSLPLPLPPPRPDKSLGEGTVGVRVPDASSMSPAENKVAALRAYRHARNLC
jgi:hypothetical protein